MSLSAEVSPELLSLAKAVGLLDADGRVEPAWFEDPMAGVGSLLTDPIQREAFDQLLETILPPIEHAAAEPGEVWHPLLDPGLAGNIFLTRDGDRIGLAASVATTGGSPGATAFLRLPLVEIVNQAPVAVAGMPGSPLEVGLEASWPGGEHGDLAVLVSADVEGGGSVRVVLEDPDPDAPPGSLTTLDPFALGGDAADALAHLFLLAAEQVTGDADSVRAANHLPGLLGLNGAGDPLRLSTLVDDPSGFVAWLADLAEDAATLRAWFGHLAGLAGAGPPDGSPTVAGAASPADPLRAEILDLGGTARLELLLSTGTGDQGGPLLRVGVALSAEAGAGRLEAEAILLALPLDGSGPIVAAPEVGAVLVVPASGALVDEAPAVKIGTLRCGIRLADQAVVPRLELVDAVFGGQSYPLLDLTDANAVVDAASAGLSAALDAAMGGSRVGEAMLALAGLRAPASDPLWPHAVDLATLAQNPTGAIADVHRASLGDPQHGWEHLLAELAAMLDLTDPVTGSGTTDDPWSVSIAAEGIVSLELSAWDAGPDGSGALHRLRLGVQIRFDSAPWEGTWRSEVLGFDLRQQGSGSARWAGAHRLSLALAPVAPVTTPGGFELEASRFATELDVSPAAPARWSLTAADLEWRGASDHVGPVTLQLSDATYDPAAPDLGLGIDPGTVLELLRGLFSEALTSWAGPEAVALAALLGLHRGLRGLPPDWPLIAPPDPADLGSLLADPAGALRAHADRVLSDRSADGTPFVLAGLPWARALLGGQVPDRPHATHPPGLPLGGSGTWERPWTLPVAGDRLEGVAWLDPDGPPKEWWLALAEELRGVRTGAGLVTRLDAAAGLIPEIAAVLDGRDRPWSGAGIDRLEDWLRTSDGVVPLAAQWLADSAWSRGAPIAAAHHDLPRDPAAITQIQTTLEGWEGGPVTTPVVLLAPEFEDSRVWSDYLAAVEPDRPPEAHFDLRAPEIDPLTLTFDDITALATHYTADLAPDELPRMAAQLANVVGRILALTGATQVYLVGHSTAGLVARLLGVAERGQVAGVVTLATPHRPCHIEPLIDSRSADAVRLADAVYPAAGRNATGDAVAYLTSALNGTRPVVPDAFVSIGGDADEPLGFAIRAQLADDFVADLAAAAADRLVERANGVVPPTHYGVGIRAGLDLPEGPEAGALDVDAGVRSDLVVRPFGGVTDAGRQAPAMSVEVGLGRTQQVWLVGGPAQQHERRLRRLDAAIVLTRGSDGVLAAEPTLRLHDAGVDSARPWVDLDDILNDPPTEPVVLIETDPDPGSVEATVLDALTALALALPDGSGGFEVDVVELEAVAAQPLARLGPRLPALLDAVITAIGGDRPVVGQWRIQLADEPVELTVETDPWLVRVRTTDATGALLALPLGNEVELDLDASLPLPSLSATFDAGLRIAATEVEWSSIDGEVTLHLPGSTQPLVLWPAPPASLRNELGARLPEVAAAAVAAGVLGGLADTGVRVGGIQTLFTQPVDWLLSPDGLGAVDGSGLDGTRVEAALGLIGDALGLDTTAGIAVPGGFVVSAGGSDPLVIGASGTLSLRGGADALTLDLGVSIDPSPAIEPTGSGTLRLLLPDGGWGGVTIDFGAGTGGLTLGVTPDDTARIQLLPTFSGFGDLAGTAVALLPALLQAAVDEIAPQPLNSTGLTRAALDLARTLGVYDFDAQGFEEPARAAELARALEPGWLGDRATDGAAIAAAIEAVFGSSALSVLPGTVSASGEVVTWTHDIDATQTLRIRFGWEGVGSGAPPLVTVELLGVVLGPLVLGRLHAGTDQGVVAAASVHLAPSGPLSFLTPAVESDLGGGSLTLDLLPLGPSTEDRFRIRFAPAPGVTADATAGLDLIQAWATPLLAWFLLDSFESDLDRSLWTGGPSTRTVLEQAGLLDPAAGTTTLASPVPPPADLALGALRAPADDFTLEVTPDLALILRSDAGRLGLQLRGGQSIESGELEIAVQVGDAEWLEDDADAGILLWLLEDVSGSPPVRITPSLHLAGVGALLGRVDGDPLLTGIFEIGKAGGSLFLDVDLLDGSRQPTVHVTELGGAAEFLDGRVVVAASDGDGFVQKVLPAELQAPFDAGVRWRPAEGLTFLHGSPGEGLELTFPLDLDLVVIRLAELFLGIQVTPPTTRLEAGLTGTAELGPLQAVVQRVGVKATFTASGTELGFRAPDGVGLSLDAGVVTGGGFLYVDEARGEYAGAVQLRMQGLSLTAIGILNTRNVDGTPLSSGFSLLIVIAAEFPPIQLGFGFTLNGIGGILGLDRTMDVDELRAGVRNQALDSMLFPPDPIGSAPTLIETLGAAFPIAEGRFVVGPMIRLGWGTPTILTLDVGVLLELPDPLRIVVLGRMKLALPEEDLLAIVVINLDVLGIVDFELGEVSIDAVIYDSQIAGFSLSGDMALRARWLNDPTFALAVGGFHPAYEAPPEFPKLARVAIALSAGDNPRLSMEAYLAVTSNTIQFGAGVYAYAESLGFEVEGELSFDALMQFDPFGLRVDIHGSLSVKFEGANICSVSVDLHLSGPSPWHVQGSVTVSVLLASATISLEATLGTARETVPPPPVDVEERILAAIPLAPNWSAQAPTGEEVVTLKPLLDGTAVAAHPLGGLTFRQRVAPLDVELDRYGAADLEGRDFFAIDEVRLGGRPVADTDLEEVRDNFAPAHYFELTEAEKLARPSFESLAAGVALEFDQYVVDELGAQEAAPLGYQLIVVDEEEDGSAPSTLVLSAHIAVGIDGSATGIGTRRRGGLKRFQAPGAQIGLKKREFAVVSSTDATGPPETTSASYTEAVGELRKLDAADTPLTVVGVRSALP